jgi:hypothetical protein
MNQTVRRIAGAVVIFTLHQAARAVADPDDGYLDR